MKKITLIIILFTQIIFAQFNEFKGNRMLSITIDGSRLIEDASEFDSGLDIVGTLIIDRSALIQPLVKFEAFPNINYYKFAVGGNFTIKINDRKGYDLFTELSAGVEVGQIIRQDPGYECYSGFWTYGFNFETRIFKPLKNLPIIASYNLQKRTDFHMYGTPQKFVGSLFLGLGFIF